MSSESAFLSSFRDFQSSQRNPSPSGASSNTTANPISNLLTNPFSSGTSNNQDSEDASLLSNLGFSGRSRPPPTLTICGFSIPLPTFTLSRSQRFKLTISLLAIGVLNFLLAFITLPVILISPGKFATTFTIGSLCLFSCIAVLRGVGTHLKAIFARDRVVVTVAYLGSLIGTVWASFGKKGWLAVWICIIVQMASLLWYFVSYIPGGTSGLLSMSRFVGRSVLPI